MYARYQRSANEHLEQSFSRSDHRRVHRHRCIGIA